MNGADKAGPLADHSTVQGFEAGGGVNVKPIWISEPINEYLSELGTGRSGTRTAHQCLRLQRRRNQTKPRTSTGTPEATHCYS